MGFSGLGRALAWTTRRFSAPELSLAPRARPCAAGRAPGARVIHASSGRRDFRKDIIFGTNWPSPATPEAGVELRRAGWFPIRESESIRGERDTKSAHAEYEAALAHQCPLRAPASGLDGLAALGFREPWFGGRRSHVETVREAVGTALERGGSVAFYLGNFCMHRHFRDCLRMEVDHAQAGGFAKFLETATLRMLAPALGGAPDPRKPTVTSVELAEFFEGALKSVDLRVYAPRHGGPLTLLDAGEFRLRYEAAMEETRSPRCKEHFRRYRELPAQIRAVMELQRFVHGHATPLAEMRSPKEHKAGAARLGADFG